MLIPSDRTKIINTALFEKMKTLLTLFFFLRKLFDTNKPTIERLQDLRAVEYADGLLQRLGSKENVSSIIDVLRNIFDPFLCIERNYR